MKKQRVYENGKMPTERKMQLTVEISLSTSSPVSGGYESETKISSVRQTVIMSSTSYSRIKDLKKEIDSIIEESLEKVENSMDNDLMLTDGAE